MTIFVYTLTFVIHKNGEGFAASVSRAFTKREKAEGWLIDTPARAKEVLENAGEGWKILYWFPKVSCHVMDLEM